MLLKLNGDYSKLDNHKSLPKLQCSGHSQKYIQTKYSENKDKGIKMVKQNTQHKEGLNGRIEQQKRYGIVKQMAESQM